MSDTPETDAAERESIAAYIEFYGPNSMFPCDGYDHARKLERERDDARERADTMFAKHADILDNARSERDEAIQARKQSAAEWLGITRLADNRTTRAKRERDEARERADTMFAKHADILDNARSERDAAMQCHEWCREDRKRIIAEAAAVTEQRDRLAEALLELRNNESFSIGGAAYEIVEQALQYEIVEQSLQSLTTN